MPTYEYACEACGHKFEEFQSITAKPTKKCPVCRKNKVKRLISAGGGFIFKGSGFYITDYRTDNYKAGEKTAGSSSETKSTAAGTSETPAPAAAPKSDAKPASTPKTDSKPAPKSESKPAKPTSKR